MNPFYPVAREFVEFARARGWRCALIGGLAVGRWGRPRATDDIDFTLWVELGDESECIQALLKQFPARIDDPEEFAMTSRILVLSGKGGVPIDVAMASFPFESPLFDRATDFKFARGISIPTVSAEDLVFLKATANRELDWTDIEGILVAQGANLNVRLIESQLAGIRDIIEFDEIMPRFQEVCRRHQTG